MLNALKRLFVRKDTRSLRASFWVLFAFSIVSLIAAFVLSMEEMHLIKHPDATLSCSFNLVLNCATVMQTWQASVFFGIPNMFIGLMAFPVLIAVTVAALWGGAQYKNGFLLAMNIGIALGTIFAYWLFFNSVYAIQVLCPWCLVVTFSCTMLLAASTHITLRENILKLKKSTNEKVQQYLDGTYHQLVVASWAVLMAALVFIKFGAELFA